MCVCNYIIYEQSILFGEHTPQKKPLADNGWEASTEMIKTVQIKGECAQDLEN